jgi:hypothetical protein
MIRKVKTADVSQREIYRCEYPTRVRLHSYRIQQLKYPLEINNGIRATQF